MVPHLTMWSGPRPTSVPSGILIHPTVWPQYTNVTDRTDRQQSDNIGQTALQKIAQKLWHFWKRTNIAAGNKNPEQNHDHTIMASWRTSTALIIVASHVDYCNSLLYSVPTSTINKLQRVQNSLAIAVNQSYWWDFETTPLASCTRAHLVQSGNPCLQRQPAHLRSPLRHVVSFYQLTGSCCVTDTM